MSVDSARQTIYYRVAKGLTGTLLTDSVDQLIREAQKEILIELIDEWPWIIDHMPTRDDVTCWYTERGARHE